MIMLIDEHIDLAINESENIFLSYTYPLFIVSLNGRPDLLASSTLIKHNNKYYLITASHVIDELIKAGSSFYLGVCDQFIKLEKEFIRSEPPEGKPKDNFDIAIYKLSSDFVRDYSMNYVTKEKMYIEHTLDSIHLTCIHGYPCSKNKQVKALKGGTIFKSRPFTYAGNNINFNELWIKYNKYSELHSCMSYENIRKTDGNIESPPSPQGISGGGMWVIPNSFTPKNIYLKGIFIEYYAKEKICFCTNIDKVLMFIDALPSQLLE